MKSFLLVSFMFAVMDLQSQPRIQSAFCKFVASFNQGQFDPIYNEFNDGFRAQADHAVVTGGLLHVFETNGRIVSAAIERQTVDEGSYVVIGERGVFRVLLSVDAAERIDGLRIKAMPTEVPPPAPSLVFIPNVRRSSGSSFSKP